MQAALREFAPLSMREASATVLPFASGHLPRPPPPAYIYTSPSTGTSACALKSVRTRLVPLLTTSRSGPPTVPLHPSQLVYFTCGK